ncbi:MAG: type II toxin-antitoxin system HicB family antitoxin [Candidatus Paceibacterota bacterium]
MKKTDLKNIVWKEGDQYVALCLNADVSSFGDTKDEALANLNEALELYFEDQSDADRHEVTEPEIVNSTI